MNNKVRNLFILLVVSILSLPLIYFSGVKDKTNIYGVERTVKRPTLQNHKYYDNSFQKAFDAWWENNFMFRKFLLKTKNQIYDWINFGQYHAGYWGNIIQGKNSYLFEKFYLSAAYTQGCNDYVKKKICALVDTVARLQCELKKKNVDFLFVLAPSKIRTYPEIVPDRYQFFKRKKNACNIYDLWEEQLAKNNINFYNAQNLMNELRQRFVDRSPNGEKMRNEPYDPYSYSGTHWNLYGAAMTVRESLKLLGYDNVTITDVVMG